MGHNWTIFLFQKFYNNLIFPFYTTIYFFNGTKVIGTKNILALKAYKVLIAKLEK
jgi:hypothetical protein